MRALFLTNERGLRGGEKQLSLLADGLRARGWELVLGAPSGAKLAEGWRGPVVAIPMANNVDPRGVLAIRKAIHAHAPDVIHAFTARAHALARLARAQPLIVTRAVSFRAGKGALGRIKYKRGVERFIAVSQAVAKQLELAGADPQRIRVVPVGVPAVVADPSARLRPDAPFVIAAAGALEPAKGFDVLLHALVDLPGTTLLLAGEGDDRAELEALAKKLGISQRVRFLGWLSGLSGLLGAADAFVMSSRSEGMPMALIEAMSAGVPVVATRVGGIPEVVDDGQDGLLVPAEDASALANAIRRIADDRSLGRELGKRGVEKAKRFAPETMALRTEEVYSEILAPRRRASP
ncbi:MAG: glycosyltransferase [Deltaproteobacteria bacterium]|nr:glycosyltransferase [Deltaproteobacteria bacterium]